MYVYMHGLPLLKQRCRHAGEARVVASGAARGSAGGPTVCQVRRAPPRCPFCPSPIHTRRRARFLPLTQNTDKTEMLL